MQMLLDAPMQVSFGGLDDIKKLCLKSVTFLSCCYICCSNGYISPS